MKTVKFWDNTEQIISDDQAKQLKEAFNSGIEHAEIAGHWFKLSAVAEIRSGGIADVFKNKQIDKPEQPAIAGSLKGKLKSKHPEVYKRVYG